MTRSTTVTILYAAALLGGVAIGVTADGYRDILGICDVADWYTLSHVVHGMLVVLLGRTFPGLLPYPALLFIATGTGVAWEIVEHTDWVLNQFRDVTVYQGYIGDSVLNSVMDYAFMWAGFFLAIAVTTLGIVLLILFMEVTAAITGRDCLTFTTLQLVYPLEAISAYQQAINPQSQPR